MWPTLISPQGLQHLAQHKYVAGDYSVGDLLLTPWWNTAVKLLPLWMAPNLVTLLGTSALLASGALAALNTVRCGMSGTSLLPWVNLFIAGALFFYQTLDAIDGKQARRTGSSSPLGQLFDHGCDALCTIVVAFNLSSAIGYTTDWHAAVMLMGGLLLFFAGQWEEYFTRVLRTSVNRYMGVTEAQFVLMAVHLASAFLPCDFWYQRVEFTLPTGKIVHIALNQLVCYALSSATFFSLSRFALNVVVYRGNARALLMTLPSLVIVATIALFFSPATQGWFNLSDSTNGSPRTLLLSAALALTHITTQLIVFSMAREPFPLAQTVAWVFPLVAVADARWLEYNAGAAALSLYVGVVVCSYFLFVLGAIDEISGHLGLFAFSLKPRKRRPTGAAAATAKAASASAAPAAPAAQETEHAAAAHPKAPTPAKASRGRRSGASKSPSPGKSKAARSKSSSTTPRSSKKQA